MDDRYKIISRIGRGAFADVFLGKHRYKRGAEETVAIKVESKDSPQKESRSYMNAKFYFIFRREILLRHVEVCQMCGISKTGRKMFLWLWIILKLV